MRPSSFFSPLCQITLHGLCMFTFVALSVPLAANEPFLNKPSNQWTEAEALQMLNDSPWTHTITTTTQEAPCDYEHPAFPGLFREEMAQTADLRSTQFPAESVKPDGAEYVVRLVSVKPMQAAVERLISLDEKWDPYRQGIGLELGSRPTNREQSWYNPADEIIILVSLKRPGPAEASFLDYAFEHRADGTAFTVCLRSGANSERSNSCRHESHLRGEGQQGVGNYHVFSQPRRRETADLASRRKVRVPLHPQSESV